MAPECRPAGRTTTRALTLHGLKPANSGSATQTAALRTARNRSIVDRTGVIALSMVRHHPYRMQDRFRRCRRIALLRKCRLY
jgi:hypothetical protein